MGSRACDMIVNLNNLPEMPKLDEDIKIKRLYPADKKRLLVFVAENFDENWVYEAEYSAMQEVTKVFIAEKDKKIVGFACFDASGKGFFGPTGVREDLRGKNIGAALLIRTLQSMREYGYGYGIIGWVDEAIGFYEKCVNARLIEGGEPQNSVYSQLVGI